MSSPVTPFALPQALMTHASLKATTATTSTPLSLIASKFSMYGGRCFAEQPGVKAPALLSGLSSGDCRLDTRLTRNREKHHLFICPFFGSIVVYGDTTRGYVALFFGVGNVARKWGAIQYSVISN